MTDFDNIEYLKSGNDRQRLAYHVLKKFRIFTILKDFDPILAGTIPINIDIADSDLDILCYWTDRQYFLDSIRNMFSWQKDFVMREIESLDAIVTCFRIENFEIEIFGQNIPTRQQNGYRHMLVEHHLLCKFGEEFRLKITGLKKQGYKTEPAFALVLELQGNPYSELLKYETEFLAKS